MAVVRISDFIENSDFAGSRKSGEKVREDIEQKLKDNTGVTLDFVHINMITQSFGDEIIGILTRIHGVDFIKKNIRLHNYNDEIKNILNYVVKYSNKFHKEEVA